MEARWLAAGAALLLALGCGRLGFDPDVAAGPTFRQLCAFERFTIIENGIAEDDAVGMSLGSSLGSGCDLAPAITTVSQNDPTAVDQDSGRPLTPSDELILVGGGDGPHRVVRYLLADDSPVVWSGSNPATFVERSSGRTIVSGPTSSEHDFLLVMVVDEPIGGTRVLSAQGISESGTIAAGQYFDRELAPSIASMSFTWVVVEWTDDDDVVGPSPADTFAVIEMR